jgi:hypothetical protein
LRAWTLSQRLARHPQYGFVTMMNKLAAVLLSSTFALAAGCASESDGGLHLSGRLADAKRVTHVIATNPTTGERIVVDMKTDGQPDGRFSISVPTNGSWIVTFADASQVGAAMRVATLQTGGIDAFSSKNGGSVDFGTVHFSGNRAHGTVTWNELVDAFGYDQTTLEQMAKTDDLALRYSNPDVDGDGELDALQGRDYRLELAGTFRMEIAGRAMAVSDLVTGIRNPSVKYAGTSIAAAVPRSMDMNMKSGTVTFEQAFFGTAMGPDTAMVAPGTRIGQPHVKFGELAGNPLLGVVAQPERQAPSGNYRFDFDNGSLTFTDVHAPSAANLMAATHYAVPFVSIRSSQPACVTDCEISSVDITWMRQTAAGWTQAAEPTDAHVDFVTKMNGKNTYLATDFVNGETSVQWQDMPVQGTGILRSELAYISTAELCYVAVTYTSSLGMKLTSQVQNPGCF